ncbi:helix-turn-helix transcriptional regulator [Cognatilysobacter tabacisoli]|uniref:helix-turn-helix transcriptional regulator n=1 Tax=Cognatilysobacter tabacisoli TaxID=2315424 RepID=UPI00387E96E9
MRTVETKKMKSAIETYGLRSKHAAAYLGVSCSTLRRWRQNGLGPVYQKYGARTFRYQFADLDAFRMAYSVSKRQATP